MLVKHLFTYTNYSAIERSFWGSSLEREYIGKRENVFQVANMIKDCPVISTPYILGCNKKGNIIFRSMDPLIKAGGDYYYSIEEIASMELSEKAVSMFSGSELCFHILNFITGFLAFTTPEERLYFYFSEKYDSALYYFARGLWITCYYTVPFIGDERKGLFVHAKLLVWLFATWILSIYNMDFISFVWIAYIPVAVFLYEGLRRANKAVGLRRARKDLDSSRGTASVGTVERVVNFE